MELEEFLASLSEIDKQRLKTMEKNTCNKVRVGDAEATVCRLDDRRYRVVEVVNIEPEALEFSIHNLDLVPAKRPEREYKPQ